MWCPGLFVAWIRLNNPAQYNSYTTEMVKGVIAGFENSSVDREVVADCFYRDRTQRLLHRRQHQRIFRVLQQTPGRIRRLYGTLQQHGGFHPDVQKAGDLPRQRDAGGRRPGNRTGLRYRDHLRSGDFRPGGPQTWIRAGRRRLRFPAVVSDRGRCHVELHQLRDVERLQNEGEEPHFQSGAGPQR